MVSSHPPVSPASSPCVSTAMVILPSVLPVRMVTTTPMGFAIGVRLPVRSVLLPLPAPAVLLELIWMPQADAKACLQTACRSAQPASAPNASTGTGSCTATVSHAPQKPTM